MFTSQLKSADTGDGLKQQQRKYLNVCVIGQLSTTADPASGTLCQYDATYQGPYLDNPKEWVVGIDRFSIPLLRTPRLVDPNTISSSLAPFVSLVCYQMPSTTPFGTSSSKVSLSLYNIVPDPFGSGYIYLASTWVRALQAALNSAMTVMLAGIPNLFLPSPMVTLDSSSGLVNMLFPTGAFTPQGVRDGLGQLWRFELYFNQALWKYYPTLPQIFLNYSTAAAPFNNSNFYSRIDMNKFTDSGIPTTVLGSSLPNFASTFPPSAITNGNGALSSALVAGTSYTQLTFSLGTTYYMPAGQAIVLHDSASGQNQTVFLAEGDCNIGSTTINVLLFTANFAFPTVTTTMRIYNIMAVPLSISVGANYSVGARFTIIDSGSMRSSFTLSRPAGSADMLLYTAPFFPQGESLNDLVVSDSLNTGYDTITTESPVAPIWTNISSVRIKSTQLPVAQELSPDVLTQSSATFSQAAVTPMVTDFVINSQDFLVTADLVQFVTENPRWIDLFGDSPLNRLDLKVFWVDLQGNEHPVYIPVGYRFDMKVNFKRKYTKCLPGF